MNEFAYTGGVGVSDGEIVLYEEWRLTFADREMQAEEDEVVGHSQPLYLRWGVLSVSTRKQAEGEDVRK